MNSSSPVDLSLLLNWIRFQFGTSPTKEEGSQDTHSVIVTALVKLNSFVEPFFRKLPNEHETKLEFLAFHQMFPIVYTLFR
jgi:hypothetical protein